MKLLLRSNFSSYQQYFFYLILDFYVKRRTRFSLRDKRLFEITEVEITRIDCMCNVRIELFLLADKHVLSVSYEILVILDLPS